MFYIVLLQQPYSDVEELTDVPESKLKENLLHHFKSGQVLNIPEDAPPPFQHIMRVRYRCNLNQVL